MSKSERTKPLNQCHNPADGGCKNPCEPGMNFCPDCMKAFGMKGDKTVPPRGRYRHPIIGVGDAAQTHLRAAISETLNGLMSMDKDELRKEIKSREAGDIANILIETGSLQLQEATPMEEVKDQIKNNAVSQSLKKRYADSPREGVFFDGFIRDWIKVEAESVGMTFQQFVKSLVWEKMPAEIIKSGMLADLRRKG